MKKIIHGVLPDHQIGQLIKDGILRGADPNRIQPASIDLTPDISTLMSLDHFTLPRKGENIDELIKSMLQSGTARKAKNVTLTPRQHYLVKLKETLTSLPCFARANPKSSIGRIFMHSRLLCDGTNTIDEIPVGYSGDLWMLLNAKFFPITLSKKESINQLRFFNGDARLSEHELRRELFNNPHLVTVPKNSSEKEYPIEVVGNTIGEIPISVDLKGKCYRTRKGVTRPLGLDERDASFWEYYEEISLEEMEHGLVIEEGRGYLIGTLEQFQVPEDMAVEVIVSDRFGEVKLHFAGFVDPKFGLLIGNSITLEIVSYEPGLCLRHGQYIGTVRFEHMTSLPRKGYSGNYVLQESGARGPKYFALV